MSFERVGARVVKAMEAIGAFALLVLMLVVFVDVVGRNLFNTPLPWGTELLEMVLAVMIFMLYPLLALSFGNITVDLIQVRPSLHKVQRVLASVLGAVVFALIGWCMGRQAIRAAGYGEATPLLGVPLAWILSGIAFMGVVCSMAFLVAMVRAARRADDHDAHPAPLFTEVI